MVGDKDYDVLGKVVIVTIKDIIHRSKLIGLINQEIETLDIINKEINKKLINKLVGIAVIVICLLTF